MIILIILIFILFILAVLYLDGRIDALRREMLRSIESVHDFISFKYQDNLEKKSTVEPVKKKKKKHV